MTELDHKPNGDFTPGNRYRFQVGNPGKLKRFNYRKMREGIVKYLHSQEELEQRFTWAGLARSLGVTRQALDTYRTADDKTSALLALYSTYMEEQLEQRLTDRHYSTAGVIRGLEVLDRERWAEHKTVDIEVKQQLSVVLTGMPKLQERFRKAGVTIDQQPNGIEDKS